MRYAVVNLSPANGKFSFSIFHETKDLAVEEAKRLSQREGKEFIVLKEVGTAKLQAQPVIFEETIN